MNNSNESQKPFDPTNSGALFRAKEKRSDKSPDYTGSINVDGKEFFVSGWKKISRANEWFLSIKLTPKDQNRQPAPAARNRNGDYDEPF